MSKARHYRRHAARRGHERHNLSLSKSDLNVLEKRIRSIMEGNDEHGRVVERQSETRSRVRVRWDNIELDVIYSRSTRAIVTILPQTP